MPVPIPNEITFVLIITELDTLVRSVREWLIFLSMVDAIWITIVSIGSGNILMPHSTKPLPEPMLNCHQWNPVASTWRQIDWKYIFKTSNKKMFLKDACFTIAATFLNSSWPTGTMWWQTSGSTLAQVMACYLLAPSHFLNQCWLVISEVQWHSYENNFTRDT